MNVFSRSLEGSRADYHADFTDLVMTFRSAAKSSSPNVLAKLGREAFDKGFIVLAHDIARTALDNPLLSEIADRHLRSGLFEYGMLIHKEAGSSASAAVLEECAHACERMRWLDDACAAYRCCLARVFGDLDSKPSRDSRLSKLPENPE